MIRRLLVIGSIAVAVAGGARFALGELRTRAWLLRKQQLVELALDQPSARRPWEVRFEALGERVGTSARFQEIARSPHHPQAAWLGPTARALTDYERVWLESLWNELAGLDGLLAELRGLPREDLEWHGPTQKLGFLRECVNALCARAWLALEERDTHAATQAYADALRLARASDDGTTMGTLVRGACQRSVLAALRAALAFGLAPDVARAALTPLLEDWSDTSARAEHVIRRDLSLLSLEEAQDPRRALAYFALVEQALANARLPASEDSAAPRAGEDAELLRQWSLATEELRALHACRNVTLTALAVADFRAQHGRYPRALEELAELPVEARLDPLRGEALSYATDGASARIGSAGNARAAPYAWDLR